MYLGITKKQKKQNINMQSCWKGCWKYTQGLIVNSENFPQDFPRWTWVSYIVGVVNGITHKYVNEFVVLALARDGWGPLLLIESRWVDGFQKGKDDVKTHLEKIERFMTKVAEGRSSRDYWPKYPDISWYFRIEIELKHCRRKDIQQSWLIIANQLQKCESRF